MEEIDKPEKSQESTQKNYYNVFPKNRDFYFLDLNEKIKDFPTTDLNDPDHICIIFENKEKQVRENIFKRSNFLNDYEFIKVIEEKSNSDLYFIIAKEKMKIGRDTRLLTEIKKRTLLMKEIFKRTKIDFNTGEYICFKESLSVPFELKFFNRIFSLYFLKQNSTNVQNNQNKIIINNNEKNDEYTGNDLNSKTIINLNVINIFNKIYDYNEYIINNNIQQGVNQPNIPKLNYIFSKRGLKNIGSTCYMNATLQCLLHVSELVIYFLQEYEKDKLILNEKNKNIESKGKISEAFFNLIKGVNEESIKDKNNYYNSYDKAFAPIEFKNVIGHYNPQFRRFEANDSKDLILYLLQTMHDEMNYYGDINKRLNYNPNQYNLNETYNHFVTNYNTNNFSKISLLFYGTYINSTTCFTCKKILYNFQKFEFISFSMENYNRKKFNILQGFQDNSSPNQLKGDNKLFCNNCNKLQEGETTCKIFEPPQNLLINIDYGINKIYQPSFTEFDEEIDITNFVVFDYKQKIRYRIIGVCTHYGYSGSSGHYVAFCKNKENNTWYEFNDSFCSECDKKEIYRGSPYLLLYEREFNN